MHFNLLSCRSYFARVLEEHGPLVEEDRLLVGELGNFPAEARRIIAEAGGLECFLLESLQFIKMGRRIGLTNHAFPLHQAGHGASLDDLDEIVSPRCDSISPDLYTVGDSFDSQTRFSPVPFEKHSVLPNPYLFPYCPMGGDAMSLWSDTNCASPAHFIPNGYTEPHLDALDDIYGDSETNSASNKHILPTDENCSHSHAAVQVETSVSPSNESHLKCVNFFNARSAFCSDRRVRGS